MVVAYSEDCVSTAQNNLGTMLETAVFGLGFELGAFYQMFLQSSYADRFGAGEPSVTLGRSGVELALMVCEECGVPACLDVSWRQPTSLPAEYWTGWALAFYQWASGSTFARIQESVPVEEILSLYSPFHEMDIRQFCDKMDHLILEASPKTRLGLARQEAGLSQSELARLSGVPVRTLQQYEQRQKDFNRAQAQYLVALAHTLCCNPEDLLEYSAASNCEYAFVKF